MPNALFEHALQRHQVGDVQAAITLYSQILKQEQRADVYGNLGVALRTQGHLQAAIVAYRKSLDIESNQVSVLSNLGGGLRAIGQLDEAILVLEQAITLGPDFTAAHYNLGLVLMDAQEPEKAIACFERVLTLQPNHIEAQFDRAVCILQTGDLKRGFEAYECRFQYEKRLNKPYPQPIWDGSPLAGRTLLLCAEQGFGDTLMFSRYIPMIEKQGGRIILECPTELKRLMSTVDNLDQVISPGDKRPSFDIYLSLLSLPFVFKTTLESIPHAFPYLKVPADVSRKTLTGSRLKVGIVWGAGHQDVGVRNRSIELRHFLKLCELPNVQLYSLQKGPQSKQLYDLGCDSLIEDLGRKIQDFADTAQMIQELDLVISADTAIIHLAGALGKPVWVLLPYGSEWRWMLNRDDSPWYPSMKLFRQKIAFDWEEVIHCLMNALKHLTQPSLPIMIE